MVVVVTKTLPPANIVGIGGNGAGRWLVSCEDNKLRLSDDLVTYTAGVLAPVGWYGGANYIVPNSRAVAWDGVGWVIASAAGIAWSTDGAGGAAWSASTLSSLYQGEGGPGADAICFANGILCVVSERGHVSMSTDRGVTWQLKYTLPKMGNYAVGQRGVVHTGTHWVVWGYAPTFAYSVDDGATWVELKPLGLSALGGWFAYCAGGWFAATFGGAAKKSTDNGATWAWLADQPEVMSAASSSGTLGYFHTRPTTGFRVTSDLETWDLVLRPSGGDPVTYADKVAAGNGALVLFGDAAIGVLYLESPTPDAVLPLRLSIGAAPPLRLPLRLSVGSSAPGRALPLRLSVTPASLRADFDGGATWAAAPAGRWQLSVTLGAADISPRVQGDCIVQIAADSARTADFEFLPSAPVAVLGLIGQRVRIAFAQFGGAGAQVVFQGVVDVPTVDLATGVIRCTCTDQAQELWSNTPRAAIDTLVGGRWSEAVTGAAENNFDYLRARIASVGASWALDVQQQPRVILWAAPARTLNVTAADVVDGSLAIDLPSRNELRTEVVCRLQYRYTVLRSRGISAQYTQPLSFFLPWVSSSTGQKVKDPTLWLTTSMIEGAAASVPGWELARALSIEHPAAGSYLTTRPFLDPIPPAGALTSGGVYIIRPETAVALALGFDAGYVTRWQQSVTEDYTVKVRWATLEAQVGAPVSEESGATLVAGFDQPGWDADLSVAPHVGTGAVGDTSVPWQPPGYDTAARDEALRTLLDRAWVRLWSSSRSGRVRFAVPCRPDLWLDAAVKLEHSRLRASGLVVGVTHTLSVEQGRATTELSVAVGMPGNTPAAHPEWSLPAAPVDDYHPPLSAFSCTIGTYVGGMPDSPEWAEGEMVGFSTNRESGSDTAEFYPHQLRIQAPALAAEDRDPRELKSGSELIVTVPTDTLEVF